MKFIQIGFGVAEIYCKTKRCFFLNTLYKSGMGLMAADCACRHVAAKPYIGKMRWCNIRDVLYIAILLSDENITVGENSLIYYQMKAGYIASRRIWRPFRRTAVQCRSHKHCSKLI